ncbi:MAG: hypothetical protein K2H64_12380, partial [Desulfovibrio sp.]|nr:hypothetical protein [Desulfovibrio sp.]
MKNKIIFVCCVLAAFGFTAFPVSSPLAADARGSFSSPQDLRGAVNHGGPEDWPEHEGLSTSSGSPLPGAPSFDPPETAPLTAPPSGSIGEAAPVSSPSPGSVGDESAPVYREPDYQTYPAAQTTHAPAPAPQTPVAQPAATPTSPATGRSPADVETRVTGEGSAISGQPSRGHVEHPATEPAPPPAPQE